MKFFLFIFLLVGLVTVSFPPYVLANGSQPSLFQLSQQVKDQDRRATEQALHRKRVARLSYYLRSKDSPMAANAADFVECGSRYGVDYKLLVGISGKESSFGRINSGTYNSWGWTTGLKHGPRFQSFASVRDAICTVSAGIAKGYAGMSLRQLAYKYAPPTVNGVFENNTEGWIANVRQFISEQEALGI